MGARVALFAAALSWVAAAAATSALDVGAANNAFAFRLLDAVQSTVPDRNVVLAPVGAFLNLSMLLDGADGQTRAELLTALSLTGQSLDAIDSANARLISTLRAPAQGIALSLAGSLWVNRQSATLSPGFVNRTRASYAAKVAAIDFSGTSGASRINAWASMETHGAIPKAIDKLDPAEVALLLNAVYFKGEWAHKFDKARTQAREFTLAGGGSRQVPSMVQSGRLDYFETPEMQSVRLPFGGGDLAMEVFLPAKSSALRTFVTELTPEQWKAWQSRYASHLGTLQLPRFELRADERLTGPLQSLGIKRAFEPTAAQLAGMFSSSAARGGRPFVSAVLQSIYWKVDEEGAEAAAVTTTRVQPTVVMRPFQMTVDRPFMCAVVDERSGALLFVAAIYDPGQSG